MKNVISFGTPVSFLMVALAAIVAGVPASAPAYASGECVSATVSSPFRLPNGRLYQPGTLTLCDNGTFSPVGNLHRISADGSTVGLFLSRKRNAETQSILAPEILFERDAEGNLVLVGYSAPESGRMVAYRLRRYDESLQASTHHKRHEGGTAVAPVASIIAAGAH